MKCSDITELQKKLPEAFPKIVPFRNDNGIINVKRIQKELAQKNSHTTKNCS